MKVLENMRHRGAEGADNKTGDGAGIMLHQVNCVAPGVIKTAMNSHLDKQTLEMLKEETPLGVIGTTEDVAQMVGFLASDHSDFITGQVFGINGGMVI